MPAGPLKSASFSSLGSSGVEEAAGIPNELDIFKSSHRAEHSERKDEKILIYGGNDSGRLSSIAQVGKREQKATCIDSMWGIICNATFVLPDRKWRAISSQNWARGSMSPHALMRRTMQGCGWSNRRSYRFNLRRTLLI